MNPQPEWNACIKELPETFERIYRNELDYKTVESRLFSQKVSRSQTDFSKLQSLKINYSFLIS